MAKLLRLRLAGGMGTILYRARLARYEAHRLNFDLTVAKRYVVYREDRRFREHAGVDVRAIARSIGQRLKGNSAGGGKTITQQLARTLFIVDLNKKLRRKVIEVLLAYWLDRQVEKDEQLEIYLCAVRYARGVNGKRYSSSNEALFRQDRPVRCSDFGSGGTYIVRNRQIPGGGCLPDAKFDDDIGSD